MTISRSFRIALIGTLLVLPISVIAENSGSSGSADTGGTTITTDASGSSANSGTSAEGNTGTPPAPKPQLRTREIPMKSNMDARESGSGEKVMNGTPLRGAATGTRPMLASSTHPISSEMKKMIEDRERMMSERRNSDCSVENASGTNCLMERSERMEELRERVEARRGEILKRMTNLMITRMRAAITRESTLADRFDSRVSKLKERGIDTATAEANIAITRTKIAEAKEAVDRAESAIASAVIAADADTASSSPRSDAGKPIREELSKAREAVFAAHKSLVNALTSLKASIKIAPLAPASTTPQTGPAATTSTVQ